MMVMSAMLALREEAILELEELVSTKVIALETTVAKTAVKTVVVKRKPTTLGKCGNCEGVGETFEAAASAERTTAPACTLC